MVRGGAPGTSGALPRNIKTYRGRVETVPGWTRRKNSRGAFYPFCPDCALPRTSGTAHRARSLAPARSLARCPTSSGAAARSSGLARSLPLARSPGAQLLPGRRPRNFRGVAPEHKNLPQPCANSSGMDTPEEFPRCVLFFLSRLRSAPDVRDRAPESRCAVEIHKLPRKGEAPPSGVSPRSHETPEKVLGIPLLKAVFLPVSI